MSSAGMIVCNASIRAARQSLAVASAACPALSRSPNGKQVRWSFAFRHDGGFGETHMTRLTGSPMIRIADICRRPELPRQPGPKRRRRLTLMMRAVLYALRGGFLVRPLAIALVLGATGMLFSEFEEAFPPLDAWVPHVLFPSHSDPQVAQVILAGIAASIMTVVSIVFAILLMTLTLASMQFSPRILVSFVRDRTTHGRWAFFWARSATAWPPCRRRVRCRSRSVQWLRWPARCCWRCCASAG